MNKEMSMEDCIMIINGMVDAEKQMLDPDGFWGEKARDIAGELRMLIKRLPEVTASDITMRIELLKLAERVDRLDKRIGADSLREWIDGARGVGVCANPPRGGGHTEDFFVAHRLRYETSATRNGAYAAGADCVSAAMLKWAERKNDS